MNRKEANLQLLELISKAIEINPDFRFVQILEALNIYGDFYEESIDTLEIAKETALYRAIINIKTNPNKIN